MSKKATPNESDKNRRPPEDASFGTSKASPEIKINNLESTNNNHKVRKSEPIRVSVFIEEMLKVMPQEHVEKLLKSRINSSFSKPS